MSLQDAPLPSGSTSSPAGHSRILRTTVARAPGRKEQKRGQLPNAHQRPRNPRPPNTHLKPPEHAAAGDPAPPPPLAPARASNAPGRGARRVALPLPLPGCPQLGPKALRVMRG